MLLLDEGLRRDLWARLADVVEGHVRSVGDLPVAPRLDPEGLRRMLSEFSFEAPREPQAVLDFTVEGLRRHQVHTPHPMYFGLFNPAPTTMGVLADTLVAAFNPQIAAWSHSPFAAEVERHVLRRLGASFGYTEATTDGVFASGGAEANHTAVLAALTRTFPEFGRRGVRALAQEPVLYVSTEAHHSFLKAARLCGLGTDAVREIAVDEELRMRPAALAEAIADDRREGRAPFLVVATAGTTAAGAIDPLAPIAEVAEAERTWLHVDAAWGGAAALVPALRHVLTGVERADSITVDAHKWLSVPMGAGIFLTRHPEVLEQTFRVGATGYMPREAARLDVVDPYAHSIQWSRRFIGLKVFLSLAVAGFPGYAEALGSMAALGDHLRRALHAAAFPVVNHTPLPLACFTDGLHRGRSEEHLQRLGETVVTSGRAWLSYVVLAGRTPALRACITNFRTRPEDVDALVAALVDARRAVSGGNP
jgi:glutamate/tyrosine decarboxylase-like PLP-dependent enzyme